MLDPGHCRLTSRLNPQLAALDLCRTFSDPAQDDEEIVVGSENMLILKEKVYDHFDIKLNGFALFLATGGPTWRSDPSLSTDLAELKSAELVDTKNREYLLKPTGVSVTVSRCILPGLTWLPAVAVLTSLNQLSLSFSDLRLQRTFAILATFVPTVVSLTKALAMAKRPGPGGDKENQNAAHNSTPSVSMSASSRSRLSMAHLGELRENRERSKEKEGTEVSVTRSRGTQVSSIYGSVSLSLYIYIRVCIYNKALILITLISLIALLPFQ